jgi:hypothetical protein
MTSAPYYPGADSFKSQRLLPEKNPIARLPLSVISIVLPGLGRRGGRRFPHGWRHGLRSSARVQNKSYASTEDLRLCRLLCGLAAPARNAVLTSNLTLTCAGGSASGAGEGERKGPSRPGRAEPFRSAERRSR